MTTNLERQHSDRRCEAPEGGTINEVTVGQIGSAGAGEAATAKALLRWFKQLSRKDGRALAKEHKAGILSAHEVIRYIENEAGDLLPEGYVFGCSPVYSDIIPLDDDGRPMLTKAPEGYAYFVEECDEELVEELEPEERWLQRKSIERRIDRRPWRRQQQPRAA